MDNMINTILEKQKDDLCKPKMSKNDFVLEKFTEVYNEYKKNTHFQGICAIGYNKNDKTKYDTILYADPDLTDKVLKITKKLIKDLGINPDQNLFNILVNMCMFSYIVFSQYFAASLSVMNSEEFDEDTREKIVKFQHAVLEYIKDEEKNKS